MPQQYLQAPCLSALNVKNLRKIWVEIGVIRVIGIQVSLKLGKFSYMKFVANI